MKNDSTSVRKVFSLVLFFLFAITLIMGCTPKTGDSETEKEEARFPAPTATERPAIEKKKILYVNSYHEGYAWSDGIEKGLAMALSEADFPLEMEIFRMDTKRNNQEDFMIHQGEAVKNKVLQLKPDLLLGSDDNFIRYAVLPHSLYNQVPLIFSGINWDASAYNLPPDRVTGMIEIDPFLETIEIMKQFALGDKLGWLGRDDISNLKSLENSETILNIHYEKKVKVQDFTSWKSEYLKLQDTMDMLLLFNPVGLDGWDEGEAQAFVLENTRIPTGNTLSSQINISLLGKVKVPEELGWWMGKQALEYLQGKAISEIPWETNSHFRLVINMPLANRLGYQFSTDQLEEASLWNNQGDTP